MSEANKELLDRWFAEVECGPHFVQLRLHENYRQAGPLTYAGTQSSVATSAAAVCCLLKCTAADGSGVST